MRLSSAVEFIDTDAEVTVELSADGQRIWMSVEGGRGDVPVTFLRVKVKKVLLSDRRTVKEDPE